MQMIRRLLLPLLAVLGILGAVPVKAEEMPTFTLVMRADNDGEGGIMALTALAQRSLAPSSKAFYVAGVLGVFGAALFFGAADFVPV